MITGALRRSARTGARYAAVPCLLLLCGAFAACRDEAYIRVDRIEIPHTATLESLTPAQQKLFHPSIVVWKPAEENVVLSWEVIATATILSRTAGPGEGIIGGPSNPIRVAACDNRNADTNQPFDPQLITGSWSRFFPGSFRQCGHPSFPPGAFPFDAAINPVAYTNCVDVPNPCPGAAKNNFPYCQSACSVTVDTDSVFAFPYPPGVPSAPPFGRIDLSPAYEVVSTIRVLGRRMAFDHRNDAIDTDYWTWTPDTTSDGTQFENFSPGLFISKVRAFIWTETAADPEARRYLTLTKFAPRGTQIECTPGAGDATQITDQDCPSLAGFTPGFSRERPEDIGQTILWQLAVRPGDPGNQGLADTSPVFVEFTLGNSRNQHAGPRLSSATMDLGSTPAGSAIDNRSLILENPFAGGKWRLGRVEVLGQDAGAFSVDMGASAPPMDLWPSASLHVAIHLDASTPGAKEAAIAFRLTDPGGTATTLSAAVTARVLSLATLTLAPDHLDFTGPASLSLPWTRRFLIENDGALPLSRQGMLLEGPDAANFRLLAEDGVSAPPSATTIPSGQSEAFVVEYCPRESNRRHQARLHIYAANGSNSGQPVEALLPLTGDAPPSVVFCLER